MNVSFVFTFEHLFHKQTLKTANVKTMFKGALLPLVGINFHCSFENCLDRMFMIEVIFINSADVLGL